VARAAKAATTQVRIAPYRSVVIDGRARGAGEVVSVPTTDAETLLVEGYALSPDAQPEPVSDAPARAQYDGNGAEVEHTESGRRLLTPRSIEDGTEERGR
jgi:hypothetical protein